MTNIRTIGNQTFLTSPANNISINVAHVVKVYETEYFYQPESHCEEEKEPIEVMCIAILLTDNTVTYLSAHPKGWRQGSNNWNYTVHNDTLLVREILKTFFY